MGIFLPPKKLEWIIEFELYTLRPIDHKLAPINLKTQILIAIWFSSNSSGITISPFFTGKRRCFEYKLDTFTYADGLNIITFLI